jgi:hypothetical protein
VNCQPKWDGEKKTWSSNYKTKEEKEQRIGIKNRLKKQIQWERVLTWNKLIKSESNSRHLGIDEIFKL